MGGRFEGISISHAKEILQHAAMLMSHNDLCCSSLEGVPTCGGTESPPWGSRARKVAQEGLSRTGMWALF